MAAVIVLRTPCVLLSWGILSFPPASQRTKELTPHFVGVDAFFVHAPRTGISDMCKIEFNVNSRTVAGKKDIRLIPIMRTTPMPSNHCGAFDEFHTLSDTAQKIMW